MAPNVAQFVGLALAQAGDRYVFGADPSPDNRNPTAFDCSGLVDWATSRLGVRLAAPSQNQLNRSIHIPLDQGIHTRGALIGHDGYGADGHIAISLGNGTTIEAKGRAYGVGVFSTAGRRFTRAGLVPGLDYGPDTTPGIPPGMDPVALSKWWAAVAEYLKALQEELMSEHGLAVDLVMNPNGSGQGYQLDRWGGIHSLNGAKPVPKDAPYWKGWDIARRLVITDWTKPAGYVLDGWGGVHAFGGAHVVTGAGYWPNS